MKFVLTALSLLTFCNANVETKVAEKVVEKSKELKHVFVSGGNSGIGLALTAQLVSEENCFVFMGTRSAWKGVDAIKELELPEELEKLIVPIKLDVTNPSSVTEAAKHIKAKLGDKKLYAIVNNAGTGYKHGVPKEQVINTNFYGPKRMTDAFVPLLDDNEGRIVNVGSDNGAEYVSNQLESEQKMLTSDQTTWKEIEDYVKLKYSRESESGAYGLSKASLHTYTMITAREHPHLKVSAISPGFIDTKMTVGLGAELRPDEGTGSIRHALFGHLEGSGHYYESDSVRSPLHYVRYPGEDAFTGY
jgi:carbonyl reductase 1